MPRSKSISGKIAATPAAESCPDLLWMKQADSDGLFSLVGESRFLMAAIDPATWVLQYGNRAFCDRCEVRDRPTPVKLLDLLPEWETVTIEELYRQQLLERLLWQYRQIDLRHLELRHRSAIARGPSRRRPLRFWLNTDGVLIDRVDPDLDEFADLDNNSFSLEKLEEWAQNLQLENYRLGGVLLLEGMEVTESERENRLIRRLIDRDAMLQPKGWDGVERQMRSLFDATRCLFLRPWGEEVHVFTHLDTAPRQPTVYSRDGVEDSPLYQAILEHKVTGVSDLSDVQSTELEKQLLDLSLRSLLLIPLKVQSTVSPSSREQLLGVVVLGRDRPDGFSSKDRDRAQNLIPALVAAVSYTNQKRFSNLRGIHPAVEWRFLEEAERRSWGLPPEIILFEDVVPLFGMSDIRGSSDERNRAIQADLLEQFQLGLAVVDAICHNQETALGRQLREDLVEYIAQLQQGVTVDVEVRATEYLQTQLEVYFDYFSRCSEEALAAVEAYQTACDNDEGCVYKARSRYDEMLNLINSCLQENWGDWQQKMQAIVPHYCDVECSDGMDHMIYAGQSIYPEFSPFHLKSLRYEQLRAMCDCGRKLMNLKAESQVGLDLAHVVLVQHTTIDIFHDENTEKVFDVRGTRDIRYEIVKKRIDKGVDWERGDRITQPGMLTVVYSTDAEWQEYEQYLRYLMREGWVEPKLEFGRVAPLPGVHGLKYARVRIVKA
ncbi:MAG: GAF domain-containing protein [Limnospira sp.]